jgi:predicted nucleic acid-binding protein
MIHLLDVNVLLAAIWQRHPDFAKADAWLAGRQVATCALSELGFLRVSTHQKALKADMNASRQLLQAFLQKHQAQFVPADLPALKSSAKKSEEITDLYLAELAASKGMKFATLDAGIKHPAVEVIT